MSDLLAARSQMAMSLAFHIIFASIGVGLPLMMTLAELRWLRTQDPVFLLIAKRWAKGTAILFSIGALSGTVLSFELGLLWPRFMAAAGAVIGMPFSLEGFAFFTEAIFLGIYLFGWKRVSPGLHLFAGVIVTLSGLVSAIFVTFANAWMNTPTGFRFSDGKFVDIHPFTAMLSPAAIPEAVHMALAAYCAVGFATAGIHSWLLLRQGYNRFHEAAIVLSLTVGVTATLLQFVSGDTLARMVAAQQPVKLASLEGQFKTEKGAPLRIGGFPDVRKEETKYAIEIPSGLSLLAFHDLDATVRGLDDFPRSDWPKVSIVHVCFQIMVGCGSFLLLIGASFIFLVRSNLPFSSRHRFLWMLVFAAPLGFIALEAGWMVTELGRQPWIVQGYLRTRDGVTSMPHLEIPFLGLTCIYLLLAIVVVWLMSAHVIATPGAIEFATAIEGEAFGA